MKKRRRSIRLSNYDYSQQGAYFITICTYKRRYLFGEIINNEMNLNQAGLVAKKCWNNIPNHFPEVSLDAYTIMPNHVHGILVINSQENKPPVVNEFQHVSSKSIGSIIRGFKIGVSKWFHENTDICDVWQRNYYEHIIRDEKDLEEIREYIIYNSLKWDEDELKID
ncbi:MAG: transposase [candidate division WOR-3 bacterium]|nr:transposase [candidate division WOR-3 bacterium]